MKPVSNATSRSAIRATAIELAAEASPHRAAISTAAAASTASPRAMVRARLVGPRHPTSRLGAIEACALRRARGLIAQLGIADVCRPDRDEKVLCDREGDELVVRENWKSGVVHFWLLSPAREEPKMNDDRDPDRDPDPDPGFRLKNPL
jgi:hypothetical protein